MAGCVTLVIGLVRGRDNLLRAGRTYTWVILLGAVVATLALQHALITRDFTLQYVANNDSRATPLLFRITAMWSNLSGFDPAVGTGARRLPGRGGGPLPPARHRPAGGLGDRHRLRGGRLLLRADDDGVQSRSRTVHGATPTDGPGPDPLLQNHILVAFHPPLLYLGLVGFTVPFAFACASLITGRVGEGWLHRDPPLDPLRLGLPDRRRDPGGVVELPGARLGRLLGLGPGGERRLHPVDHGDRLPALGDGPGAPGHAARLEPVAGDGDLQPDHPGHVPHPLGGARVGPLVQQHRDRCRPAEPSSEWWRPAGVGLLAWRGDRLRSPGAIDSPVSREGAFLANNLLFGAFALVVLLGTVFPLIAQAVNGQQITVGAPYFDRMTMPIVVCLLFLMAVAPVLPWRKASAELLRRRLFWPAVAAVAVLVACVAAGVRGLNPLLAFGLGAFAGASALRQLVLATRRQGWRGLVGRANGGMIVHIGVVLDRRGLRRQPLLCAADPAVAEAGPDRPPSTGTASRFSASTT